MKDMEERYGESFCQYFSTLSHMVEFDSGQVRGNLKKARDALRSGDRATTHYLPTFTSGILLGVAFPALVAGLYQSMSCHQCQGRKG